VPGIVVGWIENDRMLVNQYVNAAGGTAFNQAVIYSAEGSQLAITALPELTGIQAVDADSVYDPGKNTIYSLTTGQAIWSGSLPFAGNSNFPLGALIGSGVVYQSDNSVVLETPSTP
jgi:hypothetical protein